MCDAAQMRQVLWNLVRNGVQATAAGTGVVVSVRAVGSRVEMVVTDEGPGITKDASEKIFDAFYTTRSHGAGIGLAVVRRIIDDHAAAGATIAVRAAQPQPAEQANPATSQPPPPGGGTGAAFVVGLARANAPGKTDDNRDAIVAGSENARSRSRKTLEN